MTATLTLALPQGYLTPTLTAQEPLLRAILLESTILPYFADSLRHARKVRVDRYKRTI